MSTVVIRAEGVDITDSCIIKGASFTAASKGAAGQAKVRVRDLRHERLLRIGTELTLDIDGIRKWGGYIMAISRGYFFDETPGNCNDHLVPRYFEIEASDYNILLQKRVLYNKSDPTILELTRFPAGTTDQEFLTYYLTNHSDLLDDGISLAIDAVGSPIVEEFMSFAAGGKVADLLQYARSDTGAIDYITPDKVLRHVDDDTANAAFGISDDPGVGEVGCREWEIDFDGANLRNDALVWGAGQGADTPVFSRSTDATSVGDHGVWQVGDFKTSIWHEDLTKRIADSYVYGSPQNLRGGKDDAVSSKLTIYTPDFTVAEKVPLRSTVLEYSDTLPIRSESISFPTPTDPRYDLILGRDIDDPWSTMEFWWPNWVLPDFRFKPPVINWPPFDQCTPPPCEEETFTRADTSNGWGASEIGESLTWSTSSLAALIGGQGFLQTSVDFSTPVQSILFDMPMPLEVSWDMRWTAIPSSPHVGTPFVSGGISINFSAFVGNATGPSMWVAASGDGGVRFAFLRTGSSQVLGGASVLTGYTANRMVSCKFRVEEGIVYGKIWYRGDPEPSDWQASFESATPSPTRLVAFGRNQTSDEPTDIYMDNIRVCSSLGVVPLNACWTGESAVFQAKAQIIHNPGMSWVAPANLSDRISNSTGFQFFLSSQTAVPTSIGGEGMPITARRIEPQMFNGVEVAPFEGCSPNDPDDIWISTASGAFYLTGAGDAFFYLKAEVSQTQTRYKAWVVGDAEPDWQLTGAGYDFSAWQSIYFSSLDGHGSNPDCYGADIIVGLSGVTRQGHSVKIADVSLTGFGPAPQQDTFGRSTTAGWGTSDLNGDSWERYYFGNYFPDAGPLVDLVDGEFGLVARYNTYDIGTQNSSVVHRLPLTCQITREQCLGLYPADTPCGGQWISETLTRIPTPSGRPPDKAYYSSSYQWSPGTMQVWVDGLLISGHSFIGNYYLKYVEIDSSIDVGDGTVPKTIRGYYFATCIHVFIN